MQTRMRVLIALFVGAFCFFCLWSVAVFAENISAGPSISFSEAEFDFKDVNEGDTVEHRFTVHNNGDQPLMINEVKTSCRCTVSNYDRMISPGGEGSVILSLNTMEKKGEIQETATVFSNDPARSRSTLTLKANVRVFITVEPRGVILEGFKGDEIVRKVTIMAYKDEPLTLKPAKYSLAGMISYEIKTIEEGKKYEAVISNISKAAGKYNGNITLDTNYPEKPQISIRFVGVIGGDLLVRPDAINFGRLEKIEDPVLLERMQVGADSRYQRSIYMMLNKGDNLKIEKIDINTDIFETEIKEISPGKSYAIAVKIKPDRVPAGNVKEEMKIYTNQKDFPVQVVPIRLQSIDLSRERKMRRGRNEREM